MKTSKDLSASSITMTCEELEDANVDFVENVIYETELEEAKYVTPVRTFCGWACDCTVLKKVGKGFIVDTSVGGAIPVKLDCVLRTVGVITAP